MSVESRVAAARTRLAAEGFSALAVNAPANVAYLTGFDGVFDQEPASVAVVTDGLLALYTDGRYVEVVEAAATGTPWEVRLVRDGLWATVASDVASGPTEGRVAVESSLPVGVFRRIERDLPGRVEAVEEWIEQQRRVKDAEEISRIAAAQQLTDATFERAIDIVGSGITEAALALDLEVFMRANGSEGVAFAPIVAAGPNSSRPHAVPSEREIALGDLVVLDFGAKVDGYCADMTRTVVVGTASARQREIYDAVRAANLAGIAAVAAGVTGAEADAAAREVLVTRGLGEYFTHGLGHGVGREVHEMPTVSARGTTALGAGEVVTIEPGAYVPGFGGVRIEDLVVVEERGCRVLTTSTKDLIEV